VHSRPTANSQILKVLAVVSLAAILLGYHGWRLVGHSALDSAYDALKSINMGSNYDRLDQPGSGNIYLELARWLGIFVEFSALTFLFTSIFSEQWTLLTARLLIKGHIIVIGDTEFADRFGEVEESSVIHLRNLVDPVEQVGRLIRLPFRGRVEESFRNAAVDRARAVLVATEDDARTISLAIAASRRVTAGDRQVQVLARLHDYWLAQRLHNLPDAQLVQAVSEPALAARDAMRRHPAFLDAHDQGAEHIHVLMFGEPDWLEAMMTEIILTAGTTRYGKPMMTLGCGQVAAFRSRLGERYPELAEEVELRFVELGTPHPWELTDFHLSRLPGPRVTGAYFLFPQEANSISCYLAFLGQAGAMPDFKAPTFVLTDSYEFVTPPSGSALRPLQPVPFGARRQIVAACGLLSGTAGLTEQVYHDAYLGFAPREAAASKPWFQLSEEYRIANRRAVAHIFAKLFDAGFDLRGWMERHDVWSALPALNEGESLYRDAEERERLSVLEHQRWSRDRRLNGWRYGEKRDEVRKLHPDLRPYDELSEPIKDFDRKFIDLLDSILPRRPGGMRRRTEGINV